MDVTDQSISNLATRLGADSIEATTKAGSGHATSALSAAHLIATLFARHLRWDVDDPDNPANDRFVLSKGHGAPVLYAALAATGVIDRELLLELRQAGSPLEGHPVPTVPFIDVATGSLGQGLANGLGMAIALKRRRSPGRVWVMIGDSEMAEGAVWEALALASHHRVSNLIAILDMNRLGQTGQTMYGWDPELYQDRVRSFGWYTVLVDGHDPHDISQGLERAQADGPAMVIARTVKGYGVSALADQADMHGKALSEDEAEEAIEELSPPSPTRVEVRPPPDYREPAKPRKEPDYPSFTDPIPTRDAFGEAVSALAQAEARLMVLDAEVGDSTRIEKVAEVAPEQFIQTYIAKQAIAGAAVGMQAVGLIPVISTFGAFLTRAHDFLRMAVISRARIVVNGSHAGVSIGADGPSQMGLDDMAMMRGLGSVVLYPADANATVGLLQVAVEHPGMSYVRTTRGETPVLYDQHSHFHLGGSATLRDSHHDRATIVASGITVFEALNAADQLEVEGIPVRVIDAYSVQPIDTAALRAAGRDTGSIITVEDHSPVGGLGDAVLDAVGDLGIPVMKLAVTTMPGSATPEAQLDFAGISARAIVAAVRKAVGDRSVLASSDSGTETE